MANKSVQGRKLLVRSTLDGPIRKGGGWLRPSPGGELCVIRPYQKTVQDMFLYKKLVAAAVVILLGVPSVSMAGSFTVSLVQGKTPAEAVQIIAEQIDLLTGRVASLEDKQAQLEADVSQNKSDTELEIERLKLENENLRLKTDEALTETAKTRAGEARSAQCSELSAQIRIKEDTVSAPFEARIKPIQDEIRVLSVQLQKQNKSSVDSSNIEDYQAQLNALNEAVKTTRAQINAKRGDIDAISVEMEKALDTLHATAEVKALQAQLDTFLCA